MTSFDTGKKGKECNVYLAFLKMSIHPLSLAWPIVLKSSSLMRLILSSRMPSILFRTS